MWRNSIKKLFISVLKTFPAQYNELKNNNCDMFFVLFCFYQYAEKVTILTTVTFFLAKFYPTNKITW